MDLNTEDVPERFNALKAQLESLSAEIELFRGAPDEKAHLERIQARAEGAINEILDVLEKIKKHPEFDNVAMLDIVRLLKGK